MKNCGKCDHDEDCFDRIREEANGFFSIAQGKTEHDILEAITELNSRLQKLEKKRKK